MEVVSVVISIFALGLSFIVFRYSLLKERPNLSIKLLKIFDNKEFGSSVVITFVAINKSTLPTSLIGGYYQITGPHDGEVNYTQKFDIPLKSTNDSAYSLPINIPPKSTVPIKVSIPTRGYYAPITEQHSPELHINSIDQSLTITTNEIVAILNKKPQSLKPPKI